MPLDPNTQLKLVRGADDLNECLRWLGETRPGWMGVDTETTGLEWWWGYSKMRTLQIGDELTGWTIPWDYAGAFKAPLREYIRTHPVVMHHAKFDLHWLREAGFQLDDLHRNIHDTSVMARLVEPLKSGALKSAATRHVDPMAGAGDGMLHRAFRKHGWWWDTIPIDTEIYWTYASLDPVLTTHLANYYYPIIGQKPIYEIERVNAVSIAYDMERLGVCANMPYVNERYDVLEEYLDRLGAWVLEHTAGAVTNPNADQQVRRFLIASGVEFTKVTPKAADILGSDSLSDGVLSVETQTEESRSLLRAAKGKSKNETEMWNGFPVKYLSLDGDALAAMRHPVADAVKLFRDQHRVRNTYLKAYRTMTDDRGYIHPSIKTLEAVTGRMSVERPSLQNIPRSEHPRNAIMASPGNVLVLSDYDQIEMRLMAHYADDQRMVAAIEEGDRRAADGQTGYDVHSVNARLVYGIPMDSPVPKEKRDKTKNTGFAVVYGAGDERVAMTSGVSVIEAKGFRDLFLSSFPGIERYMKSLDTYANAMWNREKQAYVESALGRRWYIPHPNDSYKLTNYTIQGEAAIVLKRGLIRLREQGLTEYMRLPVHDEIILDVPEAEAAEVARIVPLVLRDDSYRVALSADAKIVRVWGDAYRTAA
jgi:DNA polymerase-1